MAAKYVLGVNTLQMNQDHDYGGVVANQLAHARAHLGIFKDTLPQAARGTAAAGRLPRRARKTCTCGPGPICTPTAPTAIANGAAATPSSSCKLRIPLTETKAVNTPPGQGTFDLADPRIIVPGDPDRSLILHRMKLTGLGRMPHVALKIVDQPAVDLFARGSRISKTNRCFPVPERFIRGW